MTAAKQTAIVTGGTRGIGLAIAHCLARDGYDLVLGYNSNHKSAESASQQLQEAHGVRVMCVAGDVAKPETTDALFACVQKHFDNIATAFIHNAGLFVGVTTEGKQAFAAFDDEYEYYQKVYPRFFKRGIERALHCQGLRYVIALSSRGCNSMQAPVLGYEMPGQARASMEFLVRYYARTLCKRGINVNCIIPGLVETEAWDGLFAQQAMPREVIEARVREKGQQRWQRADEIGEIATFLCSPRASAITGLALLADGGMHLDM